MTQVGLMIAVLDVSEQLTNQLAVCVMVLVIMIPITIAMLVKSADKKKKMEETEEWQKEYDKSCEARRRREIDEDNKRIAARDALRAEREAMRKATTPVKTRLLDSGTTTQVQSGGAVQALGRAIIGDVVAGPLGALAGAATTPSKVSEQRQVAFKVWFEDGHTEIQVLNLPDDRYKKYLELLEE